MRGRGGCRSIFLGTLACCAILPAIADSPPPANDVARLPDIESVRISPDGRTLAWISGNNGRPLIQLYDIDAKEFLKPAASGERYALRHLEWGNDNILLATLRLHRVFGPESDFRWTIEYQRILAVDKANRGTSRLLLSELPQYDNLRNPLLLIRPGREASAILAGRQEVQSPGCANAPRKSPGIFHNAPNICLRYNLFQVDLATGNSKTIGSGANETFRWYVDSTGAVIARLDWSGSMLGARVTVPDGNGWRVAQELEDVYSLEPLGVEAAGKALLALGERGGDAISLWRLPLDGQAIAPAYDGKEIVEGVITDIYSGAVTGLSLGGDRQLVHWLDPQLAKLQSAVDRAFPDRRVSIVSRSVNSRRVVVQVDALSVAPRYYVIDFDRGAADMIGEAYPELSAYQPGDVTVIRYGARDGIEIPAFLTLPPGREPSRLPLVVLLHDGISERDPSSFDWRSQFLASRGYAVLQPQFRGSSGFGATLQVAGKQAWGGGIQDDVRDGVTHLAARGLADGRRVCVVGEGFGGWVALSGAVLAPDFYACVVGINPVTDIQEMYEYLDSRYSLGGGSWLPYWNKRIGAPRSPAIAAASPARRADRLPPHVLLIHARDDAEIPYTLSQKLAKILAKKEKLERFLTIENEGHSFQTESSRQQLLSALEEFLAGHLGPRP